MKWRMKSREVDVERIETILHAHAVGDIRALPKWIREGFAVGDISCDGEWVIYNKRDMDRMSCASSDSWLISGLMGNSFALTDKQFREAYEPL